ncbi:hypothetical protein SAMN05660484_02366 [Eubacterium ruminantium]|uniref:Uncharacterized protein n=1 Tax=Eubacterium ruminantium TaxID=42322 RepID=A0A1T4LGM7_9FIRM|nr:MULTISPECIES: DUF5711 family protein [Eubacterium]MCR5368570.1 DUF5711 family protein [Eubacterium sp.]SCW66010.1 hypothetical protein SAMN05660484_02366 [Eubacterium ruminantium]SDN27610.1 hypothetical protein SAMN04490370_11549 [Eubacterium ruminantium]SJZ53922.1 hypothetical protein SAMN02745110_00852 [Eubacterium ruminantium]
MKDEDRFKKGKVIRDEVAERRKRGDKPKSNVIHVRGSAEAGKENLRRRRNKLIKKIAVFAAIVIAIATVCLITYINSIRRYRGYEVVHTAKTVYEANASYIKFGDNLLKYTPEGVSYINSNGDVVWTAGTNLKTPIATAKGNFAVVADKGGNKVVVFNTDGQVGEKTMPYKICDVEVSDKGAYAVVLESDKTNYINMYTSTGAIVYEMQTSIDKSGYPVDISISTDGKKLFTSYFLVEGINSGISLTAYNFGEVGQNTNADRMMGGFRLKDELVPKVEFLTNNVVAAFSDNHIYIYNNRDVPSLRTTINIEGEVNSIFYSNKFVGLIQRKEDKGYTMKVYDFDGKKMFNYDIDMEYDNIFASDEEIILTGGQECLIITKGGRTRFRYTFDQRIRNMISTSGYHQYIITFEDHTDTIKLKASANKKKSDKNVTKSKDELSDKEDKPSDTKNTEAESGKNTENTTGETNKTTQGGVSEESDNSKDKSE